MLGEENSSPHAINAAASNHFSISLTTTCLILYGLNFTQTHYLIVTSYLPYHTGPSLLAQATHHHAATCTVRKQFNYDDRWILRTLMMQERGFPSTSKGRILHHIYEPTEIQIMTSVGPNYVIWLSRRVTSPMRH